MTDLEFEVDKALLQLANYRNNFSPTDFCDDVMSCAEGALIHQQEMLRAQHEAIKTLREALEVIQMHVLPDSRIDSYAKAALAATKTL
jgi:hypothetical protein